MDKQDNQLEAMKHSTAHLLAAAVQKLWPETKFAIGPAIENGFYYDFELPVRITKEDLPKIEQKMEELKKENLPFEQLDLSVEDAKHKECEAGQIYKAELLDEIAREQNVNTVSCFKLGDFVDLCRGPHISSLGKVGFFKLLNIAGAYWKGNSQNKMLTRIYGTVFPTKEELGKYLWQLEEAEKRNHRRIGQEMELFAIFPEIGQGLPVWLPNGFTIRRILEDYMLEAERKLGYKHAITPVISRAELFKTSGHLDFYNESMYPPIEVDNEKLYLKPMSCPGAMLIYKYKTRSYRDLPIKLGEFGLVYRYEKSGELHGLQRVHGFTQNDAHIFCREDQITAELTEIISLLKQFYKDLGFDKYWMRLSLSDQKDKKYTIASREEWERAEKALKKTLDDNKLEYKEAPGEAAFYGPKIDIQAVNVFGKEDTISTIQFDFNLPKRFELSYIDASGKKVHPYVIHRALIGSFERFLAFLIEYYAGAFPVWISPVQVLVAPITERNVTYAQKIEKELRESDIRVRVDDRSETLQAKIRDAQMQKIPYMLVIGDKEQESGTVSLRLRTGKNTGQTSLKEFIIRIKKTISEKEAQL